MDQPNPISRRTFLGQSAVLAIGAPVLAGSGLPSLLPGRGSAKPARYAVKLSDKTIQCELCPWMCEVASGRRGRCEVRENRNGTYVTLVYGQIGAQHNDPIEKKPFYHFLPGTSAFSMGTAGCNVDCKFCQNWDLAQRRPEEISSVEFGPEEVVEYAVRSGCTSMAFTYNEPTVFIEFILDAAVVAKSRGIKTVIVSNGFINKTPLLDLCQVIDAYKVDLKAFNETYYRDVVGGKLSPVLDTLKTLKSRGVWTEIVYLVVPTLNDAETDIRAMARWILDELGPDVPLHFSKFYPQYRLKNLPPTPVAALETAWNAALDQGLHYVYLGNVPGHSGENTVCPKCHKTVVGRVGYEVFEMNVTNGRCRFCGQSIPGVWKA